MVEATDQLCDASVQERSVKVESAGFAALLPCRRLPRFTPADFVKSLNEILEQSGAEAELVPELTRFERTQVGTRVWHRRKAPPRVGATVAGVTLVVEGQDRPPFGPGEAEGLGYRSWPAGAREIARARGHLRIREAAPAPGADLDLNHDRALALTVAAAAAAELGEAAGIVWESSGIAVPADELLAAVPSLMAGEPPVALWIGTVAGRSGVLATRGLFPLLGAEVELRAPGLAREAADKIVLGLAAEILDTGQPPAEGARLAHRQRAGFFVSYQGCEDGIPAIVLEEGEADFASGAA